MKKLFLLTSCLVMISLVSCRKEEQENFTEPGKLIVDIGMVIRENDAGNGLKAFKQPEEFKVNIKKADGTVFMTFETASLMPDTIELAPGQYYVEAHSDNNLPAAFENPYYYGVSGIFTISSKAQQSVTVTCGLANTMVSIYYSDTLAGSFLDYKTTVSSALDSLVFAKDETRPGYFQPLSLNIIAELTYLEPDGSESIKILSGLIPVTYPGMHYQVFINTTIDNGKASFHVLLDETEIPVEFIDITDLADSGGIPSDTVISPGGAIGYGEILITEIMFDPVSLSDTQGEWFEIYNNSGRTINLRNLILVRDSTNSFTISDSIELLQGEYFVFARTETATDAPGQLVYGSAVSLPNAGAVIAIYNEDSGSGPGELIFSVDYGGEFFPSQAGSSLCLSSDRMNAADAVSGTSWCTSVSVYNTGDLGTPGGINDLCP